MEQKEASGGVDPEIRAISLVYDALRELDPDAQGRVLGYVAAKMQLGHRVGTMRPTDGTHTASAPLIAAIPKNDSSAEPQEQLDGISPIAKKWIQRNNLSTNGLSKIFSIGGDEIDLIASSIPGKSKRTKTHHLILLKGAASYLASGAARITHEQIKETCLHYDAYDSPNFAKYLKDFGADISGSKESGYTLTPRGLAAATELIKEMTQAVG